MKSRVKNWIDYNIENKESGEIDNRKRNQRKKVGHNEVFNDFNIHQKKQRR